MNKLFIILLLVISYSFGQSQTELPTIIPPSPTVVSLIRFEEVPVDYYSGKPDITFPIYSKNLGNGLTIPIVLRYNTMGLRIDERSGWVGTGWALDGEAIISRTVHGSADEINHISADNLKYVGIYHNGYYDLNWGSISENNMDYDIQKFLWNASGKGSGSTLEGIFDIEQDMYQLSLFGKSAKFIIEKERNQNILTIKFLKNKFNLKINVLYNNSTFEINGFIVSDTDGIKYHFNETEISKTHNESYSVSQNNAPGIIGSGMVDDIEFISAWKIKHIKINSNNIVDYDYDIITEKFKLPESIMEVDFGNYTDSNGEKCFYLGQTPCSLSELDWGNAWNYNDGIIMSKKYVTRTNLTILTKKISNISFNDGVNVEFQSQNNHPEYDHSSGGILTEIKINDNMTRKTYTFNYETTPNDRLFLKSISENNLLYTFIYKNKINLPRFGDDKKDIWGYYKESSDCFNYPLSANKNDILTGVLKSIEFPNGGKKEFKFESNTFSYNGNTLFEDSFFINNNKENIVREREAILDFDGVGSDEVYFNISEGQEVCSFSSGSIDGVIVCQLYKRDGGIWHILGALRDSYSKIYLDPGYYRLQTVNFDINTTHPMIGKITSRTMNLVSKYIYGGGLRIKRVKFKNIDGLSDLNKNYFYHNKSLRVPTSNGVIDGFLTNIKEYSLNKKHVLAEFSSEPIYHVSPIQVEIQYKVKKYLNNILNAPFTSNSVGYSSVTIKNKLSFSEDEFSKFTYITPRDYPTFSHPGYSFYPNIDHPINDNSTFHGKVLSNTIYAKDNIIKRETVFNYDSPIIINVSKSLFIYKYNCHYTQFYKTFQHYLARLPDMPFMSSSYRRIRYNNCILGPYDITPDSYTFFNNLTYNKLLLNSKITKNYFYNQAGTQNIVETTESYTYNLENYQPKTITVTDSRQGIYKKKLIYATPNYNGSNFTSDENILINQMISDNIIDKPILTKTFKNSSILATTQSIYKDGKPYTIKTSKNGLALEERLKYNKYDSYGNVLDVSKTDGSHVYYVWGYHHSKPIAKIENFDGYTTGNGLHPVIIPAIEALFEEARVASDSDIESNTFILSTLEDDLRIKLNAIRTSLPNAMVTTMTYDVLNGVTSVTNPKGDMQTYFYDNFNRLEYVKDAVGNILNKNEYHYKE